MVWCRSVVIIIGVLGGALAIIAGFSAIHASADQGRLVSVYDQGAKSVFMTTERTTADALRVAGYTIHPRDHVEPALTEELVAPSYHVNIYRARPVTVIDGAVRSKIISPYQSVKQVAKDAGVQLYPEDVTTLAPSSDLAGGGAGLELTITRAVPVTLELFGATHEVRTQQKTIGALLREKSINVEENGGVYPSIESPITPSMYIRVWKEGVQTIAVDEQLPYSVEFIYDADREIGYRELKSSGVAGLKQVSYEIEVRDGVEIRRTQLASVVVSQPQNELVVVGIKPTAKSLTKSRGAQQFIDSRGISHRETYYDLEMGRVMQACGQGGRYTVRSDGVKVDSQGYVIIAANLQRYPRCSIVETSLGLGKVYDTGGFAVVHPEGFDIATDWTNNNGR